MLKNHINLTIQVISCDREESPRYLIFKDNEVRPYVYSILTNEPIDGSDNLRLILTSDEQYLLWRKWDEMNEHNTLIQYIEKNKIILEDNNLIEYLEWFSGRKVKYNKKIRKYTKQDKYVREHYNYREHSSYTINYPSSIKDNLFDVWVYSENFEKIPCCYLVNGDRSINLKVNLLTMELMGGEDWNNHSDIKDIFYNWLVDTQTVFDRANYINLYDGWDHRSFLKLIDYIKLFNYPTSEFANNLLKEYFVWQYGEDYNFK